MSETVVGFARTSTDRQKLSLEKQKKEIIERCAEKDYHLKKVISLEISGRKDIVDPAPNDLDFGGHILNSEARPGLREILNMAKTDEIDKVVVWDYSRIARRALNTLIFKELLNSFDVEIEAIDSRNSKMEMMISIMIDEIEVDRTIRRTKQALQEKKDNDEWLGRTPSGFKTVEEHNKLEVEPWLEQCVSAINTWRNSDKSRREIAEDTAYEEITPSRMTTVQKNIDKDKPKPKYVKGERPY